jgi:zinc protease
VNAAIALVLAGCAPKVDRGPIPFEQAQQPVKVVQEADPASTDVWLEARIHAGSAYDPEGMDGLAALVAESLVEAGAGERTGQQVRDALYPTGNELEVYPDREWISLRLRCHRDHEALCVELFTDALVHPRFDDVDVKRLKANAEYAVTDDLMGSEEELGRVAFDALLYEGHPYGHPVAGRAGEVELLTPDDLRSFFASHYVREAITVGIAGGFDAATEADLERRLGPLPGTMPPELALFAAQTEKGRRMVILDTQGHATGFELGVPWGVTRNDPDFPALYLAFTALGAHRQSTGRLYRAMRADRGLNYGDYAYPEPFVQRGYESLPENGVMRSQTCWYAWIRPVTEENGPFALRLAVSELERFQRDGLTADELDDTRAYLTGFVPLLARDPGRRLSFALDAVTTGTPDLLDAIPAALPGLTLEAVNAAIQRRVVLDNLEILAVSGDGEALRQRIVSDPTTPIVYSGATPDAGQAAQDAEISALPLGLSTDRIVVQPADGLFR